jgi:hypothetical protein
LFFFFSVLGIELSASCMLSKLSIIELNPQPYVLDT